MVHILASGVFFSGFIKDLFCLPRPLSPPLTRITMSGSAALEYGFPSTHSTNAVSVAVYALYLLTSPDTVMSPWLNIVLQGTLYLYVFSIVIGRLYCGMHGFFDVFIGCALGAFIAFVQCRYGEAFDEMVVTGSLKQLLLIILIILVFVRIHPEPADDCPCFDDSVAFAGVAVGCEIAYWHYAQTSYSWSAPIPGTVPYSLEGMGLIKTIVRLSLGVLVIFAWRGIMKPSLLRILPPIFRGLEKLGLILPRRFFTKASQYNKVPGQLKDDDVIPRISDIPTILTSIRHPRRRAVSVGPQSEADAYETLAYREKRRRESVSSGQTGTPSVSRGSPMTPLSDGDQKRGPSPLGDRSGLVSRKQTKLEEYEHMMGTGTPRYSPEVVATGERSSVIATTPSNSAEYGPEGPNEEEMFSRILKPRVRYDVEVVTKLIVYSGKSSVLC
ncbi:Long-chain base-1-phosphate phosphatase [Paecilomyces lecythidis]|uniref:Long-chain base-1-phosphate phosphatase n=1 Tax=Paecilomyces lecythidis TaxID=3004212 RepID=A0ABR3YFL2_9EURO